MMERDETSRIPGYQQPPVFGQVFDAGELPERFRNMGMPYVVYDHETTTVLRYAFPEGKILKITKCGTSEALFEHAKAECRILLGLRGTPGVLHVYDYEIDEAGKRVFLLEEDGRSLSEYLAHNLIQVREIPVIGAGILDVLCRIRDAGYYHLDISPKNCYYDRGKIQIGDFNCSMPVEHVREVGEHLIGTVRYMAPESFCHYVHDERSELYAVGILLYEILNGGIEAFRPAGDAEEARKRRMNGEALPLPQYAVRYPDVLGALAACVMKACTADPEERYQTFEDMRRALAEAGFDLFAQNVDLSISGGYGDKEITVFD